MNAPLYDTLKQLSDSKPMRLHMPGHKGRLSGLFRDISSIDFTEIEPTGNLYTGEGPIALAEDLFAEAAGARDALFFSCGSTQGIFTMLSAAVGLGGSLILSRDCHKSVYHGMALLDITPIYLQPKLLPDTSLAAPVAERDLELALQAHPEARAVFLTSPSYYGVMTDVAAMARLCHRYGVYLLIDQAHGAHFPFVGLPSGAAQGADLTVVSAHKTLPALGSSSILYVGDQAPWSSKDLKKMSAVFSTTSPSYPILASIDYARQQLVQKAGDAYIRCCTMVRELRRRISEETPFYALTESETLSLDPCRLTVDTGRAGLSGHEADRMLRAKHIFVEMADERYLVAIFTCCDEPSDFESFFHALSELPTGHFMLPSLMPEACPEPEVRSSIRSALFGPRESLPLRQAAGRISAQILAPYPPGIPVVAPGEEITEKHIAYLQKKSYNIDEYIEVICHPPIL